MCKINEEFLKYSRELTKINGASVSATIKIAHPSDCTNYVISETPERIEKLALYKSGLAIYFNQTSSGLVLKSNCPFIDKEDGNIWIMNE